MVVVGIVGSIYIQGMQASTIPIQGIHVMIIKDPEDLLCGILFNFFY